MTGDVAYQSIFAQHRPLIARDHLIFEGLGFARMHAVFPSRRGMIPAVRALLDLLSETVRLLPS
jgi:hypothetical protein